MGKKGASSWLTAVKRAFRSPTKDNNNKDNDKKKKSSSNRRREEHDQEDEEKKREKRRWLFRIPANNGHQSQTKLTTMIATVPPKDYNHHASAADDHNNNHAFAMATAEAALASAQVPVEVIRLTSGPVSHSLKHHYAAIIIQTAFRAYLARRALRGLKGIVMLQALIRGQNVRKQAKITLRCMTALLRVQARIRDQRARYSHVGGRKSMFAETNNLWESRYLQDMKSLSRDGSSIAEHWDERPHTLQELEAILQSRKEAAFMRQSFQTSSFSQQQVLKTGKNNTSGNEKDKGEKKNSLNQWMATKQWEINSRASTDNHRREPVSNSIGEVDTSRPSHYSASNVLKSQYMNQHQRQPSPHPMASPRNTEPYSPSLQPPSTPLSKTRSLQVRSASPRCPKEDKSYSTANTPNLCFTSRFNSGAARYSTCANDGGAAIPNYMAATESAKARVRSQSAPRQSRPSTPDREQPHVAAKKRLSYAVVPEPPYIVAGLECISFSQNLRSPSLKSVQASNVGMGQQSCYTDSVGGDISPSSTTELRRWLR